MRFRWTLWRLRIVRSLRYFAVLFLFRPVLILVVSLCSPVFLGAKRESCSCVVSNSSRRAEINLEEWDMYDDTSLQKHLLLFQHTALNDESQGLYGPKVLI